jgi:hypothetical protein
MLASLLLAGCRTQPPTQPGGGPYTYENYLAVVNGNGGYLSFCFLPSGFTIQGPAVGAIYPQSVKACGNRLVVVNSSGNNLKVFEAGSPLAAPRTVQFEPGTNPVEIAFVPPDTAYVSCYDAGCLLKVDLASLSVAATLLVPPSQGENPDGLAVSGGKLYVALPGFGSGDTVGVVDLATFAFSVSSPVKVGENAQTLLEVGSQVHAVCTSGYNPDWTNKMKGKICVIDPATDQVVRTIDLTGSDPAFGVATGNGRVFVSGWNAGLMAYEAATGTVQRGPGNPIALPASGGLMGLATTGSSVFACSFMEDAVLEFDTETFALLRTLPVGSQPGVVAYVP